MKTTRQNPQAITLSAAETEEYESSGPEGDERRCMAKRAAQTLASASGKPVEILSHDGIRLEQILPEY